MICAYLLYNYNFSVTSEALDYYGEARTKNNKVRMPAVDCTLVHNVYIKTYMILIIAFSFKVIYVFCN